MIRGLLVAITLLCCASALAHQPSESYLELETNAGQVHVQWSIALRDLHHAVGLDADGDGAITWGELRRRGDAVATYALAGIDFSSAGGRCETGSPRLLADRRTGGGYAVLRFAAHCPSTAALRVDYRLLFDLDPSHRALLSIDGGADTTILSPDRPHAMLEPDALSTLTRYLRHGVWHIWIGFDHLLFLLVLVLPAVLVYNDAGWQPAPHVRAAGWALVKTVTAFTVAHSITLALAAFDVLVLPSRLVESLIALSILLAALNNLSPRFARAGPGIAFGFGLVHGLGFAGVLGALDLVSGTRVLALLGFNVGVELGQVLALMPVFAMAFALRGTRFYRTVILRGGSVLVMLPAGGWLLQRAAGLEFGG